MDTLSKFNPKHDDLIHDLSYDFYGKRIATCSSDQKVKVFDLEEVKSLSADGTEESSFSWILNDSWKAHDASVLKVCWAHPEFGQVLASCSFDRSIRIWEEQESEPKQSEKRWLERARLVDSRGTVQDIEFAPNHMGLKLATISVDGMLRIYEAIDVVNLAHWTIVEDFEVSSSAKEKDTEYCLSWCCSRFLPQMIAVGCGKENVVKIFRYEDSQRKWIPNEILPGHEDTVHDVAWAPSIGRSYQMVATACKDRKVRIFKLTPERGDPNKAFKVELLAVLTDHDAEVWRVEWNITGTILATSGDDGRVILWKANYLGEWSSMASLSADSQALQQKPSR